MTAFICSGNALPIRLAARQLSQQAVTISRRAPCQYKSFEKTDTML
jgi:hypothetical protein